MFKDIIGMSFKNLAMNKMRTFLTTLGIIIGIASIIALITIGQGVTGSILDQLSGLGGNRVTVSLTDTRVTPGFTEEDMGRFEELNNVAGVSPSLNANKTLTFIPGETHSVYDYEHTTYRRVIGIDNYYFDLSASEMLLAGRELYDYDVEYGTHVCILGYDLWHDLYANYDPIGETIKIENMEFTIVGILNKLVGLETTGNNSVLVPYTVAMRDLKMGLVKTFDVVVSDAAAITATVSQMHDLCADIVGSTSGYVIANQQEVMDIVLTVTDLVMGMLAGIAAISLLVGGIGIMNMMLVSVSERTAEIGLRKALGAKPSVILFQFLVEAVLISILGGALGVALGVVIAYLAAVLIGYEFTFKLSTVLLAVGFSAAVGLIFGILPARKAAKLSPIDALRTQ